MKGTYFLGNKQFETKEIDLREIREDEVLLKVEACGICGTDVHIYHGDKGSAEVVPPVILGHELAGIVEQIGSRVSTVKVGDHVTVDPNIYCGKCHYCKIGKKHLCENLYAIGVNRNGGFAEKCIVPETQCYKLRDDTPIRYGAMAEPLACCIHGIDLADIRAGDTVCVIGGGAIGLLMLQLARQAGASKVILSAPGELKHKVGLELGADAVIDPRAEDLQQRIQEELGQPGADVVIECVGTELSVTQAFSIAKRGTKVLLFSVPKPGATFPLDLSEVYQKELKICGSFINPDTQGHAVEMINNGRIRLDPIITHSYPVEQLEEGIKKQMSKDSIKVIIEPK